MGESLWERLQSRCFSGRPRASRLKSLPQKPHALGQPAAHAFPSQGWPKNAAFDLVATTAVIHQQGYSMLKWAIIFAVISLVTGLLGFRGVSGVTGTIAKVLFAIFLILFLLALLAVIGVFHIL